MDRARRAGFTALIVVVVVAAAGGFAGPRVRAASVDWPPSTLVVSEVQTGGASASDEFVEVANQGDGPVDLAGLEVVYATASGSTVTRKATWTAATILGPGKRILIANAAGVFAAVADVTYSSGFAATGGAIALRVVGGATVDAVGWGDATSSFVEGTAAAAPPAGSSLERAPGGLAGNGTDTNDNLSDWFVQGAPSPQGLSAPAVPARGRRRRPTRPRAVAQPDGRAITDAVGDAGSDAVRDSRCRHRHRRRRRRDSDADAHPDADPDADAHARPRRRRRRPRRRRRRPPTPTPTPTPTRRRDRSPRRAAGRWHRRHDPGRPDHAARRPGIRPRRVRPGRLGRDRAVSRRPGDRLVAGGDHGDRRRLHLEPVLPADAADLGVGPGRRVRVRPAGGGRARDRAPPGSHPKAGGFGSAARSSVRRTS